MSDTSGPVEGQATSTAPADTSSAPAHDPFTDRMDQLSGTVGELVTGWQQFQQAQQPAAEPEPDFWANLYGDPEPEPEPQNTLDPAALRQAYQADLQQATAPLQQALQQLQQHQAREQLLTRIPALKDPAVADATVNAMFQSLTASGASEQTIQWALQNPDQIALHFEAAEAKKLAAGQAPASEHVPGVESAGGALPGGNSAPVNPVHQAYGANQYELPKGFR